MDDKIKTSAEAAESAALPRCYEVHSDPKTPSNTSNTSNTNITTNHHHYHNHNHNHNHNISAHRFHPIPQ